MGQMKRLTMQRFYGCDHFQFEFFSFFTFEHSATSSATLPNTQILYGESQGGVGVGGNGTEDVIRYDEGLLGWARLD